MEPAFDHPVVPWDAGFEAAVRPHLRRLGAGAPIPPDTELRALGLDSLALIELLVAIEDAFELEFPDELLTAQTFRTPATLWAAVDALRTGTAVRPG
jgi:diaminopimelate decarboxylase